MWEPSNRYPDPNVQVLDPAFNALRLPLASVEQLTTGCHWSEGPVYFGDGRYVLWSDIPNDRILKWEEETGAVSVFRKTSYHANGNTRDRQGRLVTCEHRGRRVSRTEYDGTITTLMDSYQGKRLNSPNDVVVKSDGSIWFTDPVFGISGYYEGEKAESELTAAVWRIDGQTGQATMMADDIEGPNGLAFSPDESILYVVASRAEPNRLIRAFDACGPTWTATSGAAGAWAPPNWTGSGCSTRTPNRSVTSRCPNAPPTCASAAASVTACSWPPATGCIRCTSTPRARSEDNRPRAG